MNSLVRFITAAIALIVVSSSVVAEQRTVRIYNWLEYLPGEILKDFEAETGIRPVYDVFDSIEMLESKLLTGNSGYDVVFPSAANLAKFIQAGAFEPLDRSKLNNWSHLDESFMVNLAATGDEGNQYAIPYMWGTTLIGYNVDMVRKALGPDAKLDSWDLIFKEENIAKLAKCGVGFIDAANEILPITLQYLGLPSHSTSAEDYRKAQELMISIRPYINYFSSSRYGMDLANGDICVGIGWSGGVALATRLADAAGKGVKIDMILPKEGAPLWSDVMAIPKGAVNRDEAHAFLDYMMRPDVIAKATNAIGYPNANKDATALIDPSVRDNPNMYIPADRLPSLFVLKALPQNVERIRMRTWNAIRTGK
ncbi:MAG: polyamine ABC transporter substrate-binding protein [Gammaproteobacteria bacterium]|nr:polyamine ABC transporter substrate-binding protein [Gammaproteobacteria bacterium]MBU1489877.1 polyamine ABC transporter substrate-binding protein [Gammaproteobacteria bacterium]MBU2064812.1 polyamine ABC transporter substrate-binding protein [Gammaproteobacteria bacterium]MBU2218723.1 polyamine ABC transporter substrate-binding protein [Gammaproteobacteria bacterium]MBU2323327.1 polyamine ABC transporter substrate-binding protein [Gammaproteobacteria bacterium]